MCMLVDQTASAGQLVFCYRVHYRVEHHHTQRGLDEIVNNTYCQSARIDSRGIVCDRNHNRVPVYPTDQRREDVQRVWKLQPNHDYGLKQGAALVRPRHAADVRLQSRRSNPFV